MSTNPIDVLLKDIDTFQAMLRARDAEIERLNAELEYQNSIPSSQNAIIRVLQEENKLKNELLILMAQDAGLITELADALERRGIFANSNDAGLLQRAREAVKCDSDAMGF